MRNVDYSIAELPTDILMTGIQLIYPTGSGFQRYQALPFLVARIKTDEQLSVYGVQ